MTVRLNENVSSDLVCDATRLLSWELGGAGDRIEWEMVTGPQGPRLRLTVSGGTGRVVLYLSLSTVSAASLAATLARGAGLREPSRTASHDRRS
jgi:hypothetical protein